MGKGFRIALIIFFPLIVFSKEVKVFAIVKGKVEKVFVKEGQKVRKGEKLIKISEELYVYEIEKLKAQIKELERKLWKAERDYRRYEELFNRDLLAESVLENKRIDVEILKAQIESLMAQLNRLETLKSYTLISSPMNGIVKKVLVGEGSYVNGSLIPQVVIILEVKEVKR